VWSGVLREGGGVGVIFITQQLFSIFFHLLHLSHLTILPLSLKIKQPVQSGYIPLALVHIWQVFGGICIFPFL